MNQVQILDIPVCEDLVKFLQRERERERDVSFYSNIFCGLALSATEHSVYEAFPPR